MTKILDNYNNKKKISSLLQVPIYRLNKIIDNKELYNGFYYIKYEDCSIELKNTYECNKI